MNLHYIKADLLDIAKDKSKYIAHCISGDFTLGAGLAKVLNQEYNLTDRLNKQYTHFDNTNNAFLIDNIFNLVIKDKWKQTAEYSSLEKALEDMKLSLYYLDIKEIYIPKLGCGKEKLNWVDVENLIKKVFNNRDVDIYVCVK